MRFWRWPLRPSGLCSSSPPIKRKPQRCGARHSTQDHRPKQGALHRPLLRTRRRVQLFGWSNRLRPGDERQHLRAELPDLHGTISGSTASIRVAGSTYQTPGNHRGWCDVIGTYYYIRFAVTPQTPEDVREGLSLRFGSVDVPFDIGPSNWRDEATGNNGSQGLAPLADGANPKAIQPVRRLHRHGTSRRVSRYTSLGSRHHCSRNSCLPK